jgi:glycosyltransferase involved in cell wall biosynthesis
MRNVIFLQSNIPDNDAELSVLSQRWHSYLGELQSYSRNSQIGVFSVKKFSVLQSRYLLTGQINDVSRGFESNFLASRLYYLYKLISLSNQNFTIVCGDTHISFLIALALRAVSKNSIRIQTQFHGNIYSTGSQRSIMILVKVFLSKLAIIKSDSLRIVSNFQISELTKISRTAQERIVLAPIPIDYSKVALYASKKKFHLCVVGRLHAERGTKNLISIISAFKRLNPAGLIGIAGDGPDLHHFEYQLSNWIEDGSIKLLGRLKASEVAHLFASSKVLLSSAPSEGYGLSIREAALSGLHVVARHSRGTLEARAEYPSQINLFQNSSEAIELIQHVLSVETSYDKEVLIREQKKRDAEGRRALIASWV